MSEVIYLAHEAEAERRGAKFDNYGWYTDEGSICSKTTKGILTTIEEKNGEVTHHWEPFRIHKNFEIKFAVLIDTGQRREVGVPRMLDALRAIIDKLERGQPIIEEERLLEYHFEASRSY